MKYLIVNGDDFGASTGINRGILNAHREGILTSASLMVNMPAAREAALLSRETPEVSVGLHVNFTNEDASPVVALADSDACREELQRQFNQFGELMGRLPTHVDSHHHVHRRANLLPLFLDIASRYRVPLREHSAVRYFGNFYGQWDGETHPEWISPENVCRLIDANLQEGVTEMGCHPGYVDATFQSVYLAEREVELRTLCHPMVREFLTLRDIALISFRDFAQVPTSQPA
jgi:predicted glycoside hydrolase/deacetylase ChbG (UPF0249 family)